VTALLPVVYLAAGEGKRLRPLTDDRPKAMVELGGITLAERALRSLRSAGIDEVVAVTGYRSETLLALSDLVSEHRFNPRFAQADNIYSLWCARRVVERGCYIVNSDVLFENEVARRLTGQSETALLCDASHGVGEEAMKALVREGRLERLSKSLPTGSTSEYTGLCRIAPADGPVLRSILEDFVRREELGVYYEAAIEELARRRPVGVARIDGLAWAEIDDHADLARAREDVLVRVG
jgi:L-glutamine-phosphate cytidylyltransferase